MYILSLCSSKANSCPQIFVPPRIPIKLTSATSAMPSFLVLEASILWSVNLSKEYETNKASSHHFSPLLI
ncbi:hypothetical protein RO3G_14158 [Rhizopus delemar RA 99-880]|uniref:Uncharacterized protein n=1 Tax=Rhizopus delemar (strain RA 99-880 / ATCC MYA-4621 / FGSC 9543 / NRRL 43880) TaxID=246409 RepID=I1CLW7_RHIO9|nr:hypothetical protein RO3G_14158 [Rhizopus delemar RA 99-880]|eukprot:EIE89447.1 hypothetical protein RO3G_14158 [Rhizopus delemar RA 99-880]